MLAEPFRIQSIIEGVYVAWVSLISIVHASYRPFNVNNLANHSKSTENDFGNMCISFPQMPSNLRMWAGGRAIM